GGAGLGGRRRRPWSCSARVSPRWRRVYAHGFGTSSGDFDRHVAGRLGRLSRPPMFSVLVAGTCDNPGGREPFPSQPMGLSPGTRLGPYEIVAAIGAGGMGEVYRARDTRVDREVAVKVLPGALSGDPEARARFEREARAVSHLNHPHICALFDVGRVRVADASGREGDEVEFLVMEYIEGESLAAR